MKSALAFLVLARRSEIEELEQLARTCALVGAIGQLVHGLQRERGLSNVLLASRGQRFAAQRQAQLGESLRLEQAVRAGFEQLGAAPPRVGNRSRLFSRIAAVVPGLVALPALRRRIGALEVDVDEATAAYVKLIAGLLAVVFEAADGATDPEISGLLAALFNFMQGKEFAGQERACGAAAFAVGRAVESRRQQWLRLIAAQERCFRFFADFGKPALVEEWQRGQPAAETAELERLRRIACTAADTPLDPELSAAWFDCCSLRIDAMKVVEDHMTELLQARCERRVAQALDDAEAQQALLDRLPSDGGDAGAASHYFDPPGEAVRGAPAVGEPAGPFGQQFERAVLDMLHEQSRRVQAMSEELDAVRAALNERKLVERAKGLLMARRRIDEQEAHRVMRQAAMKQSRRLVDVAESVLAMADVWPDGA